MYVKQSDSVDKIAISLLDVYPVGAIYMSTSSTNPGSIFGGTWEAWGSGRVPIGVNASDTDFATVEKTGGAKSVNLAHSHTVNSHNHTISHTHTVNSHTHSTGNHTLTVNEIPAHAHNFPNNLTGWPQNSTSTKKETYNGWGSATWPYIPKVTVTSNAGGGRAHNHGNTGSASPGTKGASTSNSGSASPGTNSKLSSSQSILPPYITCYMFRRIA